MNDLEDELEEDSEEQKEKEKKKREIPYLVFEGQSFHIRSIVRLSEEDEQDLEVESGLAFVLLVHTNFYPYQLRFSYRTPELREKKRKWLETQMEKFNVIFIRENDT